MENTSPDQPRIPTSIIVIAGILFLLSGLLSTYLYYIFNRHVGVIIPPILYTSVTLIVFRMCKIPVRTKKWVIYFLLMLILYIFTWVVALFSSIIILISGIIVAGIGAMESFVLVYKFITKFRLSRLQAFLAGAVAFG